MLTQQSIKAYTERRLLLLFEGRLPPEFKALFPKPLNLQLPENRLLIKEIEYVSDKNICFEVYDKNFEEWIFADFDSLFPLNPSHAQAKFRINFNHFEIVFNFNKKIGQYEWQKTGYQALDNSRLNTNLNLLYFGLKNAYRSIVNTDLNQDNLKPEKSQVLFSRVNNFPKEDPMPEADDLLFSMKNILANLPKLSDNERSKICIRMINDLKNLKEELLQVIKVQKELLEDFRNGAIKRKQELASRNFGFDMNFPRIKSEYQKTVERISFFSERIKALDFASNIMIDKRIDILLQELRAVARQNRPQLVLMFEKARENNVHGMGDLPNDMIREIIKAAEAQEMEKVHQPSGPWYS